MAPRPVSPNRKLPLHLHIEGRVRSPIIPVNQRPLHHSFFSGLKDTDLPPAAFTALIPPPASSWLCSQPSSQVPSHPFPWTSPPLYRLPRHPCIGGYHRHSGGALGLRDCDVGLGVVAMTGQVQTEEATAKGRHSVGPEQRSQRVPSSPVSVQSPEASSSASA